jgi:CheY-like chemotaxis protein
VARPQRCKLLLCRGFLPKKGKVVALNDTPESQGSTLRVLIVDDNAAAAQTTGWMVEMMDCEFQLAHSADEALKAGDYRPHIALLDIGLPGMDGFDLCKAMRSAPEYADTVFVAQTGWEGETYRRRADEAGFHHYLVKPVPFEKLESVIAGIRAGV